MPQSLRYSLLFSFLFIFSYPAFSNNPENWEKKLSIQLQDKLNEKETIPVMVYFKEQFRFKNKVQGSKIQKAEQVFASLKQEAQSSQGQVKDFLERENISYKSFFIVNAIKVNADAETIARLAKFEEVESIAYDSPVFNAHDRLEPDESSFREGVPEWGLQIIEADKVWDLNIKGEGVVIGGQDTGYDWTHPALQNKYRGYINENEADHNYNWHDSVHEISPLHNDTIIDPSNNPCGLDVPYPCDDHNHGTHTMGTMVGLDGDNIIGVAPEAKWIGVRNMERGWGRPSTYLESFEWFLAPTDLNNENPKPELAPHVINNSWSCPLIEGCDSTNWHFMDMAVNNLREAGVFVVVSAGNNGNACGRVDAPPAMLEGSFSVGATRLVDTIDGVFIDDIAGYSSWGPVTVDNSNRLKPDISAPGSWVRSSIPGNKYSYSNGTSMAGPHVAGMVALVISAAPELAGQIEVLEEIIQLSAEPKLREAFCGEYSGEEIPNFVFGYGRINAYNAVQAAIIYSNTQNTANEPLTISLYPNPSNNYLKVEWKAAQDITNIKIADLTGKEYIYGSVSQGGQINISSLPNGYYILKLMIDHQVISKKFLKQTTL